MVFVHIIDFLCLAFSYISSCFFSPGLPPVASAALSLPPHSTGHFLFSETLGKARNRPSSLAHLDLPPYSGSMAEPISIVFTVPLSYNLIMRELDDSFTYFMSPIGGHWLLSEPGYIHQPLVTVGLSQISQLLYWLCLTSSFPSFLHLWVTYRSHPKLQCCSKEQCLSAPHFCEILDRWPLASVML